MPFAKRFGTAGRVVRRIIPGTLLALCAVAAVADPPAPASALPTVSPAQPARNDPCAFDTEVGPLTSQLRACSEWRRRQAETALSGLLDELRAQLGDDAALRDDEREHLEQRRKLLEASQKHWLEYADAECEAAYQTVFPGTHAPVFRADCHERLTRERIAALKWTYSP